MKTAKSIIVLTSIAVVAALLLSGVDKGTAQKRADADRGFKLESLREVLPEYDNEPDAESFEVELEGGERAVVFPARKDGDLVAHAVELPSPPAYGGPVDMLVGVDVDGKVTGIKVLPGHQETPGLGAKVEEEGWRSQFTGLVLDEPGGSLKVKKDDPNGLIDSVTGATITSRAVTEAVHQALLVVDQEVE
jgi:electron transport complex protein RnfG